MSRPFVLENSVTEMIPPFLIVGLGNPGAEYAATRHNVGFMAIDRLAARLAAGPWESRWRGWAATVTLEGRAGWLLKPATYMNRSGLAVAAAVAATNTPVERICVLHDDLDLACGRLKVSYDRGHGGHNGVRSIIEHLDSRGFARVRIGIGRPLPEVDVVTHVLGDFAPEEQRQIGDLLPLAAEAAIACVVHGAAAAMSRFNASAPAGAPLPPQEKNPSP